MANDPDAETTPPPMTIPPRASFSSLPNECLDLILDNLSDDPPSLGALLTVNWRLFHASIHRLVDTFLLRRKYLPPGIKEVELIITSALTHHDPHPTSLEAANAILRPHGLRLSPPQSRSLTAEIIAKGTKTTIDYSRLFRQQDLTYPTYATRFLELLQLPEDVILAFKIDQDVSIQADHKLHESYHEALIRGLQLFLLDHYAEELSEMTFDMTQAAEYLKVRHRMARLTKLTIITPYRKGDSNPQDAIQFIRDNQATFPNKATIELIFNDPSYIWINRSAYKQGASAGFHSAQFALYEAVGQPKRIQRLGNLRFYTLCVNLDVSELESFEDEDGNIDPADQIGRQTILLSTPKLTSLSLLVNTSRIFDGTVAAHQERQLGDPKPLPTLRRLMLTTVIDKKILAPIHDMATVCGATLEHLHVARRTLRNGTRYATVAEPKVPLERLVLGNWTFPALRELSIHLMLNSGVQLGSLDECPSLESLFLQITIISRQSHLSVALAPKWCLPRLRTLFLGDYTALLFNYDSLETMSSLVTLHISVANHSLDWLVKKVPRLSKHFFLSDEMARQEREETRNSTVTEEETDEGQELWTYEKWNLPKLKEIRLEGLPALVFSFGWLCVCPMLQNLTVSGSLLAYQHLRLFPAETKAPTAPYLSSSSSDLASTPLSPSLSLVKNHPLINSKLQIINLCGRWILQDDDLTFLLKYLAPNLVQLSVSTTSDDSGVTRRRYLQNGKRFLKAIMAADMSSGDDVDMEERTCPRKLVAVSSKFGIGNAAVLKLGLVPVNDEDAKKYRALGTRVYVMEGKQLIRKSDRRRYL
ncbi:hypothetical protein BG000_002329 [Podila horticola]|nr:hypothetical protein BG000_002329 [Podila horticola]